MKDRISLLLDILPNYGEILTVVGSVMVDNKETLLENKVACDRIKRYLLEKPRSIKNVNSLFNCPEFQRILYEYTGKFINIVVLKADMNNQKIVNILLFDFFVKTLWPIIVKKYIDDLCHCRCGAITCSINIKKNVYMTIYEEEDTREFFKDLKELLLHNYIIISEAVLQAGGDLLIKIMIPIVPGKYIALRY